MAEPDYLVQQLRICRKGHILLLYGRIDEGCLIGISLAASIVLAILLVLFLLLPILHNKVDADTFFQDKLYALLSDTMSEFYKFCRCTWSLDREGIHATEVLVVSILLKQLHDRLV